MNPFVLPPMIVASLTLFAATYHIIIYYNHPEPKIHGSFALTCLAVGAYSILSAGLNNAGSLSEGILWQRGQGIALSIVAITYMKFVADYLGRRHDRIIEGFMLFFCGYASFSAIDRWGLVWAVDRPAIKQMNISGWMVTYYEVEMGPLALVGTMVALALFVYLFILIIGVYHRGDKQRTRPLLYAIGIFYVAVINNSLITAGVYDFIYVIEYGFMGLVLIMTVALSKEVVEGFSAKLSLIESEERLRAIFDSVMIGIIVIDRDGKCVQCNDHWRQMIGAGKDLDGSAVPELLHPDDRDLFRTDIDTLVNGQAESVHTERRFIRANGEVFWGGLSLSPIHDPSGRIEALIGMVADISARKRLDEERARMQAELEQRVKDRTAKLAAVNEDLESFIYSVSHDLRAPLRSIEGFSLAVLEDYHDRLDDEGRDYLQRVRRASQRMAQLIDDLLALSRITHAPLDRQRVNLTSIATEIVAALRSSEPERRVTVTIEDNVTASADPNLLYAALSNLLENAWKYTSTKNDARIEFGVRNREQSDIYFVKDNGVGFDMTYHQKIFGAFERLHNESEFPGTGIGLATVYRIITRHGGKIWAKSTIGDGSIFFFTIAHGE